MCWFVGQVWMVDLATWELPHATSEFPTSLFSPVFVFSLLWCQDALSPVPRHSLWLPVNAGWLSVWELGALCRVIGEDGSCEWTHLLGCAVVCAGRVVGIRFKSLPSLVYSHYCFWKHKADLTRKKKSLNSDKNINHRLPFLLEQQVPSPAKQYFWISSGCQEPPGKSFPSQWVTALRLGS